MGKHFIILFVAAICFSISASAQKDFNNSLVFGPSNFYFIGVTEMEEFRHPIPLLVEAFQLGCYYERKIYKNFRISIGYNAWNETAFLNEARTRRGGIASREPIQIGSMLLRYSYNMTDASIFYRYNRFKKHKIKSGAGLSYCRGANTYLDSISRYGDRIFVHEIKESAYGFIATFSYDYLFLRNRLGIGPDLKYRNYSSFRFACVDYGFHVAVNF